MSEIEPQNNPLENQLNYEEVAGTILIGLGSVAVLGSAMSWMVLNYSVDPTIGKVIAGGGATFIAGWITSIHGTRRRIQNETQLTQLPE